MKIGLIGCGKQAPKHVSGLRQVGGVRVMTADRAPELARRLAAEQGLAAVETVEEIFEDPTVEAVSIATPSPTHFELISRALAAGKHVFCEKPLCETLEEARELEAKARDARRNLMVGFVYRFAPVFEVGRDAIAAGALGRPVTALFRIGGRGSHQLWKHRTATGGGAINEMLVHMLDLAVWFFGPIERAQLLSCQLLRPQRKIQGRMEEVDAEDFVQARFRTASGVEVHIQADLVTPAFSQHVEVQGDNGSLFASIDPEMPGFLFCTEPAGGYAAGKTRIETPPTNLFLAQMAEFVNSVREGRAPDRSTAADSLLVMAALEELRSQLGRSALPVLATA